ncbi:D-lactate dehydrogenase [Pluralibacter gergoviae]|uniref:Quinone-dependent D-lactate dehydrogenase n=1 Tax=Pluralibacter gergoviae TaxID=61647 RepID=A0AAI9GI42_PLUGE|nr:D-lactate dehydrogenase [Pluralibacter gergoviae]EKV0914209.1 D-lactate dehydrogenase [Pluralibacter gergoviae]EKV9908397.1 D-lactate dehydrogenase [Pluralibacter gergoviae]EKW7272308.1 D-lactate dehydrogenase [Pluralibacter gergoviae]ELD4294158.1 D-lactate dehydrogenase [Pluralibacter gergoviae]ELD4304937.1 D-lactate dehydrogenase [Pluralibacter gergoviae]
MTSQKELLRQLADASGQKQLLTHQDDKAWYTRGFRVGQGEALAVVLPLTLQALWKILQVCVAHDAIVLMQASNTGVTGGSTPDGSDYDRDVIIISTRRLKGVQVIDDNRQVIAFPGTTLTELEQTLQPLGREPHSVIGSSCIGASVVGGVCNNSGGSLIRRGPAFTEKSLFARIHDDGRLEMVNHLGIDLGKTPEAMLDNLTRQQYRTGDRPDWQGKIWADDYADRLRDVDADSPARFNGDLRYLHDSAGSAGKVVVFAVRLPTFAASAGSETFYMGSNDERELVALRRFLLTRMSELPQQAEYIHRGAFDMTVRYAKHMYLAIRRLGPQAIPRLMANKAKWDIRVGHLKLLPRNAVDRALQLFNQLTPAFVASRIMAWRDGYEHHLMIKVESAQADELQALLAEFFRERSGDFFRCDAREAADAFLVRFGVGGCTISYCDALGYNPNERLVAFDVALRRNDDAWRLELPPALAAQVEVDSCCGHFFCFVNHQDYVLKEGVDAGAFKAEVMAYLEQRGAKYPAEHNVGHLYHASCEHVAHWQQLDPTNSCNPGIGKTSKKKFWA